MISRPNTNIPGIKDRSCTLVETAAHMWAYKWPEIKRKIGKWKLGSYIKININNYSHVEKAKAT